MTKENRSKIMNCKGEQGKYCERDRATGGHDSERSSKTGRSRRVTLFMEGLHLLNGNCRVILPEDGIISGLSRLLKKIIARGAATPYQLEAAGWLPYRLCSFHERPDLFQTLLAVLFHSAANIDTNDPCRDGTQALYHFRNIVWVQASG